MIPSWSPARATGSTRSTAGPDTTSCRAAPATTWSTSPAVSPTSPGIEEIDGGAGYDVVYGTGADDVIDLTTGPALSNIEEIDGGAGNDQITGTDASETFDGGYGDDTLIGGAGDDTFLVSGSSDGLDQIDGGAGYDLVQGGAGNDVLYVSSGLSNLTGIEEIDGGAGYDVVYGTGADDVIDLTTGPALSNIEEIDGGAGNDQITGTDASETFDGGYGDDTLIGGAGDDTFLVSGSSDGLDQIDGGAGYDLVQGGAGNDVVYVSSGLSNLTGIEEIDGGAGYDVVYGTGADDVIDLTTGPALSNIEEIDGGAGNDQITGTDASETFDGGYGDDTLIGGAGDDTLVGGKGADLLDGGTGTDFATYSTSNGGVTVDLVAGAGTGGDAQGDTLANIENVTGSNYDDMLTGDGNDNVLSGGYGNDTLTGGAGEDVFVLADGFGTDVITDFDTGDSDGDGTFNDRLDVTHLTDSDGIPVKIWDVTVADDGSGNAILTFPNGESVLLLGVAPAEINSAQQMQAAGVPCYAAGTLIDTPDGPRPVELLRVDDLVNTVDRGPQPILWTRRNSQSLEDAETDQTPVLIKTGALGPDRPAQDLIVSPQHRILVGGAGQLQQIFTSEAFAPAKSLTAVPGIRHMKGKAEITWLHFACARHEVVLANGCSSESLLLGPTALNGMHSSELRALTTIFGPAPKPDAALNGPPARDCLTVGAVRRQFASQRKEKGCFVDKEIEKWDGDLAMEEHEAERATAAQLSGKHDTGAPRVA